MKKKLLQMGVLFCLLLALAISATFLTGNLRKSAFSLGGVQWQQKDCAYTNWQGSCTYVTYGGNTYYFKTAGFEEKSAEETVAKISRVLEYADTFFGENACGLTIYLGFETGEIRVTQTNLSFLENQKISEDGELSFDDLWELVKSAHPQALCAAEQYGLFYVYCLQEGIIDKNVTNEEETVARENVKTFFEEEEHLFFLDFTLPMIENVYFTEDEAAVVREAAQTFAQWYAEEYSFAEYESLCKDIAVGETGDLAEKKNEWLQSIGCEADYEELEKLLFQYDDYKDAGRDATYKIEVGDAAWLWSDLDVTTLGYSYMVTSYLPLEEARALDFAEAREYLKDYLPENLENVKICTQFVDSDINDMDYYEASSNSITIILGWSEVPFALLHEYCHHLTMGEGRILPANSLSPMTEWYSVGLANFELENRMQDYLADYMDEVTLKECGYWDDEKDCCYPLYVLNMKGTLERYEEKLAAAVPSDSSDTPFTVMTNDMAYGDKGTLAEYVIQTYGFDKLAELGKNNADFEGVLGVSFNELYFDMIEWLKLQLEE